MDPTNSKILTGQTEEHVIAWPDSHSKIKVHKEIVEKLNKLATAAKADGIDFHVVSGFRSFERQHLIWEDKLSGNRPTFDAHSKPLPFEKFSEQEKLEAILNWLAIPGSSRHHWGTDLDVYDKAAIPEGDRLKLTAEEYEHGHQKILSDWLSQKIEQNQSHGFFRPYAEDTKGVRQELWHLSYAPLSLAYYDRYDQTLFEQNLAQITFTKSDYFKQHAQTLYDRFVRDVFAPPWAT